MNSPQNHEQLRQQLKQLFKDAGYECPELLKAIDQYEETIAENVRLKQEINRLRGVIYNRSVGSMSSKLKDALRE